MHRSPGHLLNELRSYWTAFGQISHNARMYLLISILMAVSVGIQLVLYNLYLFELGYDEDVIGQVAGAAALGVALGGLPAGLFYDRFGGKVAFGLATIGIAFSMALRGLSTQPGWLIVWAVTNGLANSIYFVSIFPFLTDQSTPLERPHLYGMNLAVWTCFMMVGSLISGYLPGLWRNLLPGADLVNLQRYSLLAAAGLGILAMIPISLIHGNELNTIKRGRHNLLPSPESGRAIASGALVLALFGIVMGLIQPFYNVYFKRVFQIDDVLIGTLLSLSQLMGLISALFVPLTVQRWGLVGGSTLIMMLAAPLTFIMGLPLPLLPIAIVFLLRVGMEWLASTPLMNLMMEIVSPADRGAMSGVRLVTNYGAQALAGGVGGWLVVHAGYMWLFAAAAAIQVIAGGAVWLLFHKKQESHGRY